MLSMLSRFAGHRRMWLCLWIVIAAVWGSESAAQSKSEAAIPQQRHDEVFGARRAEIRRLPGREAIELVFLGDSITQRWESDGRYVWNKYYRARKAANLGIAGDRTQNVLWRVQQGALEGMKPKLIVLLVGTNNIEENSAEEIAEGVKAILGELQGRLPEAKILLLGLFPRQPLPESPIRHRIARTNTILRTLAEQPRVHYLDIGRVFLQADGSISRGIMPDYLHLSPKGYTRWAEAMEREITALLD